MKEISSFMKTSSVIVALSALCLSASARPVRLSEGKVHAAMNATTDACSVPYLSVSLSKNSVIDSIALGIKTRHADFRSLRLAAVSRKKAVKEDYMMVTGKREHCTNNGVEQQYKFVNEGGDSLFLSLRVFSDGVAFRYELPGVAATDSVVEEITSYTVADGASRWAQAYTKDYEGYYDLRTDGSSPDGKGLWGYPMLI